MKTSAPRRPVRLAVQWTVGLAFAVLAWATSAPGGYFDLLAFGLLWSIPAGILWFASFVYWVQREPHAMRNAWRSWMLAPLLVVLLVLRVPLRLRFAASLPAMNEVAEEAWKASAEGQSEWSSQGTRRVGLYGDCWIYIDRSTRSVVIAVRDTGFMEAGGFAYVHADETPTDTLDRYRRLWGRWHRVTIEF
jgi:hypothetical protein